VLRISLLEASPIDDGMHSFKWYTHQFCELVTAQYLQQYSIYAILGIRQH